MKTDNLEGRMLKITYFLSLIMVLSQTAQAETWVLWEIQSYIIGNDVITNSKTAVDEYTSLNSCQKALDLTVDTRLSTLNSTPEYSAKKTQESVITFIDRTTNSPQLVGQFSYSCYPINTAP